MGIQFTFGRNAGTLVVCLAFIMLFVFSMFYYGLNYHEEATFINMPSLDREMTPYERFFKETHRFDGELVHIRLKSGIDTFAIWPTNVPLVVIGSKIQVSNFLAVDKAYRVQKNN